LAVNPVLSGDFFSLPPEAFWNKALLGKDVEDIH
jgi:hypothetical protein